MDQPDVQKPFLKPHSLQAALGSSQHVSRPPEFQILLRQVKPVGRGFHNVQLFPLFISGLGFRHQNAVGLVRSAANAPAELVKLGEAEIFGIIDNHHRSVGHVHAHLHHRGGNQHTGPVVPEILHNGLLFLRRHPAVQQPHVHMGQEGLPFVQLLRHGLSLPGLLPVNQRGNHVNLPSFLQLVPDELDHLLPVLRGADGRHHLSPAPRHAVQDGNVQIPVKSQGQRPGNGGGRHHQHVRPLLPRNQLFPLIHAELVLFVNHDKAQTFRHVLPIKEGVRSHHNAALTAE